MTTAYPPETHSGVVTSWVPLTTTLTPSIGCESKFRLNGMSVVAYDPGYGLDVDTLVKCAPAAVTAWWEQRRLGLGNADLGHTAASIGPLTCPNDWTTVAESVMDSSTLAMCCPPDYYLDNGTPGVIWGDCRSILPAGAVLTYAAKDGGSPRDWTIETTTLTSSSKVGAIAVVGWNIGFEPSETSSGTSSVSSATTPLPTSSSTLSFPGDATNTGPMTRLATGDSSSETSPGLPTGATIGLGVGVAIGVIGVAALVAAMFMMRHKKKKAEAAAAVVTATQLVDDSYYPPPPGPKPAEAYGTQEMTSDHAPPQELSVRVSQSPYRPYELP